MRFYLETAGALPRRGDRCLAAVGGERVQAKYDKRRRRCCARGSARVGHSLWRGFRLGDARLARGEDVDRAPATRSTKCCLSGHGR
jgi:hypothetical protein